MSTLGDRGSFLQAREILYVKPETTSSSDGQDRL